MLLKYNYYRIAVFVSKELYFALSQVHEIKIHIILTVIKICTMCRFRLVENVVQSGRDQWPTLFCNTTSQLTNNFQTLVAAQHPKESHLLPLPLLIDRFSLFLARPEKGLHNSATVQKKKLLSVDLLQSMVFQLLFEGIPNIQEDK